MNRVLPLLTANTLRAKGLLHFYEIEHRRLIFHFTAQRYSFEECKWMVEKEEKEEEASITKTEFVIIGRNLNKLKFDKAFQACLNCPSHD
jgi:G3E family GTPase